MNIFFDVDYTLVSAQLQLRPGVEEVFEKLLDDGHRIYIWSGMGLRWPVIHRHKLESYVSGVFGKPLSDYVERLPEFEVEPFPDFVVDDYPGIVECFGGMYIREFFMNDPNDDEIHECYRIICDVAATGRSDHPRWRARTADLPAG